MNLEKMGIPKLDLLTTGAIAAMKSQENFISLSKLSQTHADLKRMGIPKFDLLTPGTVTAMKSQENFISLSKLSQAHADLKRMGIPKLGLLTTGAVAAMKSQENFISLSKLSQAHADLERMGIPKLGLLTTGAVAAMKSQENFISLSKLSKANPDLDKISIPIFLNKPKSSNNLFSNEEPINPSEISKSPIKNGIHNVLSNEYVGMYIQITIYLTLLGVVSDFDAKLMLSNFFHSYLFPFKTVNLRNKNK